MGTLWSPVGPNLSVSSPDTRSAFVLLQGKTSSPVNQTVECGFCEQASERTQQQSGYWIRRCSRCWTMPDGTESLLPPGNDFTRPLPDGHWIMYASRRGVNAEDYAGGVTRSSCWDYGRSD
jgi:hypothetical protein